MTQQDNNTRLDARVDDAIKAADAVIALQRDIISYECGSCGDGCFWKDNSREAKEIYANYERVKSVNTPPQQEPSGGVWQSIETAPKDGTTIIMWHGESGLRDRVVVGAFDEKAEHQWRFLDNPFRLTGYEHDGDGMCNAFLTTPTHWMPLPKPPKAEG